MNTNPIIYKLSCYFVVAVEISFLLFAIVSKIFTGDVPDYGGSHPDTDFYRKSFDFLNRLENCLWISLLVWIILTFVVITTLNFNVRQRHIKFGLWGFILAIVYALWDPFGLIKYLLG